MFEEIKNQLSIDSLSDFLKAKGLLVVDYLIRIGLAILAIFIVYKIISFVCRKLSEGMQRHGLSKSVCRIILGILKYGVMAATVFTVIVKLNIVTASSVAALVAAAGVGISLAAQGVLSNLAGGLILLSMKPFKEGDYISIKDTSIEGSVESISIYYTNLTTVANEHVRIPNSMLTNQAVLNSASGGMRRIEIRVNISYSEDIQKAEQILQQVMESEKRLAPDNRRVYVDSLGEHSIVMGIRAMVAAGEYADTLWDMNKQVRLALKEAGIEIPYQQLDVHIK